MSSVATPADLDLAGFACACALLFHPLGELAGVDLQAAFFRHQLGEVERESVGVVQLEGIVAGEDRGVSDAFDHRFEDLDAAVERDEEALFFGPDRALDVLALLDQFGEDVSHGIGDGVGDPVDARLLHPEVPGEAGGAAEDAAEHVAAAVVAGDRTIGDGESQHADVVGDHAHRDLVRRCRVRASGGSR